MKRAVITGRGVLSPLGCDWPSFASAVREGRSAEPRPFPGALPDDPPLCHLLSDSDALAALISTKHDEPLGAMATAAVRQALSEAGIAAGDGPLDDVGLAMNTLFGPTTWLEPYLERLQTSGPRASRPAVFVDSLLSMPASRVGIALGLRGSTTVLGGSSALEVALDWVRGGRDPAVVAGGGEFQSPKCLRYFAELVRRSGVERRVLAQGAAFVVLEEAAHADARGAGRFAELLGAGAASEPQEVALPWSADAQGTAFAAAMRGALSDACVAPDELTLIALACGDDASERNEMAAIESIVGDRAPSLTLLRPKRLLGEALGASAAISLLAALAHLEGNAGETALVNAFEMGGAVTSLIVRAAP
jgi:3-oxoacyl-[acyl-carrier-protein] synthase II